MHFGFFKDEQTLTLEVLDFLSHFSCFDMIKLQIAPTHTCWTQTLRVSLANNCSNLAEIKKNTCVILKSQSINYIKF